ncbi:hypothetical protein V8G54_022663 [Vigna mungo]|uniref:Uncharacterized protein n=1 Tax=Vigna mungo TaxID=3915 RepID=A0AAQ3N321_VIGMU
MYRDVSSCNTYNYGDALYWDARYIQEGGSFDWYQRYSALRPFVRNFIPLSSRILMVGCGNAGSVSLIVIRSSQLVWRMNLVSKHEMALVGNEGCGVALVEWLTVAATVNE